MSKRVADTQLPPVPHHLNAGNGSYPMTIEESFDQVEKMLEEHRRQRKEQKPRRVEALSIINEASPLQRHTFVFAPLDDPRILSEIAAQDAVDAREGLKKGESEMDMEVGGLGILVIDQQVSFHPGGSLAIDSANADAARIISNHTSELSQVVLTLDSHQRYHIAHGIFWENEAGESPSPFTTIYAQNITDGVWKPRDSSLHDYVLAYTQSLEANVLESALEWTKESLKPIQYVMKGSNPFTEHYSALKAEYELPYDPSMSLNTALIKSLQRAGKLVIVGEALSHCVNFTVRDLVDNWPVDRLSDLVILTGCSSAVAGFEAEAEQFLKDMAAKGLTLTTSTEFNA
ncbi:hypothetical protein JG688_00008827 [Phytophthora aleatoria]|uniref:Isochorismatase-like domain-containing protein n=1 Tax=Phytophthora aleatoria TaxID=2496075 RepID=A0A8J5J4D3_9STRA|nr:hypothetical protein JG688_00008827 [Phytophthora aleatoria]